MALVGVVGAGVMGSGVAYVLAAADHQVVLVDVRDDALKTARNEIVHYARLSRFTGSSPVDADKLLGSIDFTNDLERLAPVTAVIENITEDWERKRALYPEMEAICTASCVIAANTSAIPITRIASVCSFPERIVGVHFMNPVPLKRAVELIPGRHTSQETLERTRQILSSINQRPIEVHDSCGFVSNRVLMITINEAAALVHEGVATPEAVDDVFRSCFGHASGPLETADLIGIDTILYSLEVLQDYYADCKYRPAPILKHMVDAGLLGRKSGAGFHTYARGE